MIVLKLYKSRRTKMSHLIMTVDDSTVVRQMVNFTLKRAGYEVVEAVDGQDAMNKISDAPVKMLLADLDMPNMNGLELIKELRSRPEYRFIPIVILTTESNVSEKNRGKEAGATGWITKPFRPEQLLTIVKRMLN
jgi:two-component system chemotaxis response regulator CheY